MRARPRVCFFHEIVSHRSRSGRPRLRPVRCPDVACPACERSRGARTGDSRGAFRPRHCRAGGRGTSDARCHAEHPNQTIARRIEVAQGQTPFAAIVTCSDSRATPEFYCDQGLGDLFVVRDAGNTLNDHVLGSLEYAVEHLHVSLIVVIGHEKCGAVSAAVAGGKAAGHIASIVEAIRPAVQETRNQVGDKIDNAIRGNARRAVRELRELKVFAGRYDLTSGRVELLP